MDSQTGELREVKRQVRGEMIAVCSAKGGIGRTVMTVNLAVALCKKNIQIGVVDADFQFGDVSLALDLQTTFTIKDVVEEIQQMDQHSLLSYLNRHESGIKVLAAPERPEHADLIGEEAVSKILDLLLLEHHYVLTDTGVGLPERNLPIIEKADQILLLTNLEMATLKNTKLMLETFDMLGLKDKVQVVVNRATMESVINASDVADILGIENPIFIPNDWQVATQSLNIGIPFVVNQGKTDIAKAVFKMAEQISTRREITLIPAESKTSSLLTKLFRKSKVKS
jgi:pilus assembly protein CpaE